MKIAAVIVTYNRLELLKKNINSLKNQTKKIDQVIVVNNDSTDGTSEWLIKEQPDLKIITQSNSGGSGGFYTGVKKAYEMGYDWIWLMDDDVFPDQDCLYNLMEFASISKCIQPVRYYSDNIMVRWASYYSLAQNKKLLLDDIGLNKDYFFSNTICFEGVCIQRDIISKIGFPDRRFFLAGDDTIYGYMANLYTNILTVNNAKIMRAQKSNERKLTPAYIYYSTRNEHLLEEYYNKLIQNPIPFDFHFEYYKNLIITITSLIFNTNYSLNEKYNLLKSLFKGFLDYKAKKTGK